MFAGRRDKRNPSRGQRAALAVVRGLDGDFRDWDQIESWAARIAGRIRSHAAMEEVAR